MGKFMDGLYHQEPDPSNERKKARKRRLLEIGEEALEFLVGLDYEVVQLSEYHFRVCGRLDIFPSTRTWYDIRSRQRGQYNELKEFVINYFSVNEEM